MRIWKRKADEYIFPQEDNSNFIVNIDFASRDQTKLKKRYKSREEKQYHYN